MMTEEEFEKQLDHMEFVIESIRRIHNQRNSAALRGCLGDLDNTYNQIRGYITREINDSSNQ